MMMRSRILASLIGTVGLLLLCLFSASASAAASASATTQEPVYMMTQSELERLSSNLNELRNSNKRSQQEVKVLRKELATSKDELLEARKQSSELKKQLDLLTMASKNQETSLETVNRSLMASAKEEKRTRLRIKAQRNTWEAVAAGLLIAWAAK